MRLPVSTRWGGEALEGRVLLGVVGGVGVPDVPDDAAPCAAKDSDVLVRAAACAGAVVDVSRPGVVVAAGVGHGGDRGSEAMVAGPAQAGVAGLAGLDGDGGLGAVGCERADRGVAVAAVADLGRRRGGGGGGLWGAGQRAGGGGLGGVWKRGAGVAGGVGGPRSEGV